MLEAAEPTLALVVGEPAWQFDAPLDVIAVAQDATLGGPAMPAMPDETGPPGTPDDDAAYVFFTSGTTAVPRAVLGRHQGMAHFVGWQQQQFGIGPGDRSAQLTGLSFNVLLRDVFTPLISGATLCVPDNPADISGKRVLSWLEREQITMLHTVPSLVAAWLADVPDGVSLSKLRWVFFAGEPLTDDLVRRWRAAFPESGKLVNLYGQTESSMAKCFSVIGDEPAPGAQPVGRPMPHTQALVLRPDLRHCGIGETGEIYIRTPFLSLGYRNDPELTARRFLTNPAGMDPGDKMFRTGDRGRYRPDGTLEVLGRTDQQVKILGVRVDPHEVSATLAGCPGVAACAVTAFDDEHGTTRLAAYIAATAAGCLDAAQARAFLRRRLPTAMVPAVFVFLPSLPLTVNGKVDLAALPDPETTAGAGQQRPASQVGERLTRIWTELLAIESVGEDQDFFELGGHSLLAIEVVARIAEELGIELDPGEFFADPTIGALTRRLEARRIDERSRATDPESGTDLVSFPARS